MVAVRQSSCSSFGRRLAIRKAGEGGNVDNSFNPQHDDFSKKSPGVPGACLRIQCRRADIVPIKAKATLGEAGF
jgi:hypothetical protein